MNISEINVANKIYRVTNRVSYIANYHNNLPPTSTLKAIKEVFQSHSLPCSDIREYVRKISDGVSVTHTGMFNSGLRGIVSKFYFEAQIADLSVLFEIQKRLNEFLLLACDEEDGSPTIIVRDWYIE